MATLLLIVIYISFIGLGMPDSLFGAAWPAIYPDLGIDLSWASVYSILSSLFSTVSSMLSDRIINRFGTGRVTAVSTALTAAGLLLFAFSGNFWALCLCTIPLGLGAGTVDTALNNYVALHYSAGQMSYLHCFYGVGVAISPWLLSFTLANANDWRGGYRLMFFIQLAITAVLVLSLPLWKQTLPKESAQEVTLKAVPKRQVLKNKVARSTLLIFFGSPWSKLVIHMNCIKI
jgi:MFS family permease